MTEYYRKIAIRALNEGDFRKGVHFLRLCAESGGGRAKLEYAYILQTLDYQNESVYFSLFDILFTKEYGREAFDILFAMTCGGDPVAFEHYAALLEELYPNGLDRSVDGYSMLCDRVFENEDMTGFKICLEDFDSASFVMEQLGLDFLDYLKEARENGVGIGEYYEADTKEYEFDRGRVVENGKKDSQGREFYCGFGLHKMFQNKTESKLYDTLYDYLAAFSLVEYCKLSLVDRDGAEQLLYVKKTADNAPRVKLMKKLDAFFTRALERGYIFSSASILDMLMRRSLFGIARYYAVKCEERFAESMFKIILMRCAAAERSQDYVTLRDDFLKNNPDDGAAMRQLFTMKDYSAAIMYFEKNNCLQQSASHYYALSLYACGEYEKTLEAVRRLVDVDCFDPFYRYVIIKADEALEAQIRCKTDAPHNGLLPNEAVFIPRPSDTQTNRTQLTDKTNEVQFNSDKQSKTQLHTEDKPKQLSETQLSRDEPNDEQLSSGKSDNSNAQASTDKAGHSYTEPDLEAAAACEAYEVFQKITTLEGVLKAAGEEKYYSLLHIAVSMRMFSVKLLSEMDAVPVLSHTLRKTLLTPAVKLSVKIDILEAQAVAGKELIFSNERLLYRIKNKCKKKYRRIAFLSFCMLLRLDGDINSETLNNAGAVSAGVLEFLEKGDYVVKGAEKIVAAFTVCALDRSLSPYDVARTFDFDDEEITRFRLLLDNFSDITY